MWPPRWRGKLTTANANVPWMGGMRGHVGSSDPQKPATRGNSMITEQSTSAPMQPRSGQMAESAMGMTASGQVSQGGHLYTQTNEIRNCVIHYTRGPDGKLAEVGRIPTGGAGSGTYKPVSGQESAPNAFEGANSVILTPHRRFLFATNGGDNSVSSFSVNGDGKLTLVDAKRTGNVVTGRSGTAK